MKRADKEHFKRILTVLLVRSMLIGMAQVPQLPPVTVVAKADDNIDLLNADRDDSTFIGDTTEEDLLQQDISGGVPEEDVLHPDTAGSIPEEEEKQPDIVGDIPEEDRIQTDTAGDPDTGIEVSYIDGNGKSQTCNGYTVLIGNETELTPGWYVVDNDITFTQSLKLNKQNGSGDFHIILADGKTMNIGTESNPIGGEGGVGLGCAYDNSSKDGIKLHIYAQSSGNSAGQLNIYDSCASPQERPANEKVGDAINVDELTINGGKLNLDVTGLRSYGINSKKLTINGGDITANATVNFSDEYPGGRAIHSAGDFTINDGNITAQSGGSGGLAVLVGDNGSFTMNNGELTAVAKTDGRGLSVGNDIIINGGKVNVESNMGDGITSTTGNITINGGQVTANGVNAGIRISDRGKSLSLSWNEITDFIYASSFSIRDDNVTIPVGKAFKDGNGNYYVRANANTINGLADVKLSATNDTVHAVTFDCGGYKPVPDMQLVKDGSKAAAPTDPASESTYNSKSFAGWYQDTGYQIPFDFNSAVTSDLYLHARWVTKSTRIDDADIKMIYRYTGDNIDLVVKNNVGETLTKDTHYTITGIESEKTHSAVNEIKDPGFYNLTVTGKSPYSGIRTVRVCVLTFGKYDPSTGELNNNATLPENTDAAVVTDSTVSMNSGWYVVTEDVDVNTRMKVEGDVHLVLCDGATLNAAGNDGSMGISVTYGNSLTIYSQEGNTGRLVASSNKVNFYAGIGGNSPDKSSSDPFPYLEKNKNAGNITIHGGEIYARGSYGSAAIGMAEDGQGGRITIYGGKVTARRFSSTGTGTGIGGQNADIHLSWCRPYEDFILSDGYQGGLTFDKPFIIENTSTIATPDNIAQYVEKKIEPVESSETCTVTFDSKDGTAVEAQEVAMGRRAVKPVTPIRQRYSFAGWFKDMGLSKEYSFNSLVTEDLTLYAKWEEVSPIAYIGEDGNVSGFTAYSPMEADYEVLPTGSYYVGNNVELLNRIKVNGNVSLILGNSNTLTADKGISVMGRENTLNIFGQSGGTGILEAKAVSNNAAIGGDDGEQQLSGSVGNINIYGGNIRPQGGNAAASIGGGYLNEYYGNICIYGGTISGNNGVAARGGEYSAAIGGGFARDNEFGKKVDGTVRILGGEVTVESPESGARTGIGGGQYSYGGTIDILGGKVEVTGAQPGIGDGKSYKGEKKARITLGCKNQDDWISSAYYNGNVRIAPNQILKIENTSDTFKGDISDPTRITNKKLVLGHVHKFTYTKNETTITATCQNPGCDLTGNKATLILTAPEAADLVYDGTGKPAIVTDEYHISGDEVVHYQKKDGNDWIDAGTAAPKDAGTYRASITLTDAQTQSTAVSVEYTIKKRDVTISGLAANSKIYDGTTAASVNGTAMVLEGMVEGDAVRIVSGNAAFDSADAGNDKTVTFTGYSLTGSAAGNYNLVSQPASMTADIEKRPATVKALDQTVQFGNEILQNMVSCDGLADGQVFTSVKLTPDPDPHTYSALKDDGTITPSDAVIKKGNTDVTGNYDITYVSGNLTITLPMAKITKHPTVRTNLKYDGQLNEQALVNPGEAETRMEYNVQRIADGNGVLLKDGDRYVYEITPYEGYGNDYTAWESGSYYVWYRAASGNHIIASEPEYVSVNIAQIPLTVKVVDETIPYGEKFKLSMNVVKDGFHDRRDPGAIGAEIWYYQINGKWINFSDAGVKDTWPDLGVYPVKVQYERDNDVRDCYKIDSIPGFLYVVPRTVSLNWGDTFFTFNGNPQVPTVTLTNLSGNEDSGAVGVTVSGAQVNAGTYTAAAVALSGDKASKYALPGENTIKFSIAKADYSGAIPDIEFNVPASADSYKVSVAGKMPSDAGRLEYKNVTISSNGPDATKFNAVVDENGLVTVTKKTGTSINPGDKLYVNVNVDSTNYKTKTIKTVATFVDKSDAGIGITQGNSLSVNYSESPITRTLNATVSDPGTSGGTWTWESSDTNVAEISTGSGADRTVTIKGVGTAAITSKYDSDTTTGYATLILTVNPISVPIPEAKPGLSYNGSQQTGVESGTHYTLTGEKGTLPGIYVATATLKEPGKYRWNDGNIGVKYIPWTIEKQAGPAAPTPKGVTPTTPDNIDGRITGVNIHMEYSEDAAFSKAIPCTGSEIVGLKDGTYYVRYKETEFVKAGTAAEVVIPRVASPVVRAIQGLVYNGSPQALVSADPISEGKIYYAVTGRNDPKPDKGQYSTTLPAKTDAGSYRVWYEIRGAGDPPEAGALYVEIAQIDLRQDLYYINLSTNGIYGMEGMLDISSRIPEGECPRLRVYTVNVYKALKGEPTIDNPQAGADTMRLHYSVKKEEDCYPVSSDTVRFEFFTVSVDQMVNYRDYNVEVKIEFYKECATGHADAEALNDSFAPTCMEKGYTESIWCHDCHGIIKKEIPIDPDAHDFDMENGEVTKPPTSLTLGEHTYYCRHNRAHTLVLPDIPILPSDDGGDYRDFAEDVRSLSGNAAVDQKETKDTSTGEITKTVLVGGEEVSKIIKTKNGKEIVNSKIWVAGLQSPYTYTGSAIKPSFHVYDGTRKLTEKKDYSYSIRDNKEAGTAKIFIKFKGNYKGTTEQTVSFDIVPAVLGKDILADDIAVAVKSKAQKPIPSLIWASTGKSVSSKFFTVTYDGAESVKGEGTYTATIVSKNKNYEGRTTAIVKVVGKKGALLSKASIKLAPKSYVYTGSPIIPAKGSYTLKLGGRELVEGTDYCLERIINNTDPGTATIVFKGLGTSASSPAGTKTVTFKITGNRKLQEAGSGSDFTYSFSDKVPYAKGGAKPALIIKDRYVILKEGRDYTLSYAKNRAITSGDKKAEIRVKGKGNYRGSVTLKFTVTKQSLKAQGMIIEAKDQFTTLKKLKKPSVTVIDVDGKKLRAGTDYTVGKPETNAPGNTEEKGEVYVTVTGKGNYSSEDPVKVTFRYMQASSNLSKTRVMKSISAQTYTGSYVCLENDDLKEILYTGSKREPKYLNPGKDFIISGYDNNIKKGTAKVTVKGIGAFAGTKTLNFKIIEKKGDYKGALIGDKWR